jgi:uncharacterized cupredoxin-like copper-binding protein
MAGEENYVPKITYLLLALALILSSCAGSDQGASQSSAEITIIGEDIHFSTTELTVTVGQPVTLTLINEGALVHSLLIDELGVVIADVQPGEQGTATFTTETSGSFSFYCDVPGHVEADMTGTLIVLPVP